MRVALLSLSLALFSSSLKAQVFDFPDPYAFTEDRSNFDHLKNFSIYSLAPSISIHLKTIYSLNGRIGVYDAPTLRQVRRESASASSYPFESVKCRGNVVLAKISKECGGLYLEEDTHSSEVHPGDIIKVKNGDSVTLFSHMASFKITAGISRGAIGIDVENHYRSSPSDDLGITERRFIRAEQ